MERMTRARRELFAISLIVAPVLQGISTFLWNGTEVGLWGGTALIYSLVFWIPALIGLLWRMTPQMPRFSAWGMLLVTFACIGGVNWGNDGMYAEAYRAAGAGIISKGALLQAMGAAGPLTLHIPGLLFPVSLILIGSSIFRTKIAPSWCGLLLALGGIAFPLSRIPRIEALAHVADLLLLVPAVWMGLQMLRSADEREMESAPLNARAEIA